MPMTLKRDLPFRRESLWGVFLGQKVISRLLKNVFFVILNEVKDLELINMTRFFAALRMTN